MHLAQVMLNLNEEMQLNIDIWTLYQSETVH